MSRRPPHGSLDDEPTSIYGDASRDTRRGYDQHELATPNASDPIRVISMKTPAAPPHVQARVPQPREVKLRGISEVSGPAMQVIIPLGNLAPPRDPKEVVKRRARDYVIVGLAVVIVGSLVMLGVWWLAR